MSNGSITDHSKCQKDQCLWPTLHKREVMIKQGSWDTSTKLKSSHESSMVNFTRKAKAKEAENVVTDPILKATQDLELLCKEFLKHFKERVYNSEDTVVIEHTRKVTDLASLSLKLKSRSSILVNHL